MKNYITLSLEFHLFFARIMKEHSLFIEAGVGSCNMPYAKQADDFKKQFGELLIEAIQLSEGMISKEVLNSRELITDFTPHAEKETCKLTGIMIDPRITQMEQELLQGKQTCQPIQIQKLKMQVKELNQKAICLLNGLIVLKEEILNKVLCGEMFTANYPLLMKHMIREAKLYRSYMTELERRGMISRQNVRGVEMFWDRIMMEHSLFIRGLLDPCEEKLVDTAHTFAKEYKTLIEETKNMNNRTVGHITDKTRKITVKIRDFKAVGTKGIIDNEIQSIILPLLGDHVLREANYYLRILNE